jgi:hypothetical protein
VAITDPRDISGLVAWYSAEGETGYADAAAMTQWTDLSGNGNHAVPSGTSPKWRAATGPAGGPAVEYANNGRFDLPSGVMGAATAGEIHTYIKSSVASNNGGHWAFGTDAFASRYCYSSSQYVLDDFGSTLRRTLTQAAASVDITGWQRHRAHSAANDWGLAFNGGADVLADSNNTVAWPTQPSLGVGNPGTTSPYFSGSQSCVLLFSRKLTTAERADLDAWLVSNPSGGVPAAPGAVTVFGAAAAVVVTALDGEARSPVVVPGASAMIAAVAQPGSVALGGGPIAIPGATANVTVGAQAGAPVLGDAGQIVVLGATATVALVSHAGVVVLPVFVDSSDTFDNDGYNYSGTSRVFYEAPIAEPPPAIVREKVKRVHQSLPAPTVVNGRPTW